MILVFTIMALMAINSWNYVFISLIGPGFMSVNYEPGPDQRFDRMLSPVLRTWSTGLRRVRPRRYHACRTPHPPQLPPGSAHLSPGLSGVSAKPFVCHVVVRATQQVAARPLCCPDQNRMLLTPPPSPALSRPIHSPLSSAVLLY